MVAAVHGGGELTCRPWRAAVPGGVDIGGAVAAWRQCTAWSFRGVRVFCVGVGGVSSVKAGGRKFAECCDLALGKQ